MSVVLGELEPSERDIPVIVVSAGDYDSPVISIQQDDDEILVDYKQMEGLSRIIDRFLDR